MRLPLTYGFLGSGLFAARCLNLISRKVKPDWVLTNAPKPAGRGMKSRVTPVHALAEEIGAPLFTSAKISDDTRRLEWIGNNLPDLLLVIDFGHMIKEPLLSITPLGCFNIHPSLLPSYRGSAPVQRAIMDGLDRTGVTVFRLDAGMDSGPVLARREVIIETWDNSGTLLDKCAATGCELMLKYLCEVDPTDWDLTSQSEQGITLAPKIAKNEEEIHWPSAARSIFNQIRALFPSPVAYTTVKGKRLKILAASRVDGQGAPGTLVAVEDGLPLIACGEGLLKLERVQPEGKSDQNASDWLRGARLKPGDIIF